METVLYAKNKAGFIDSSQSMQKEDFFGIFIGVEENDGMVKTWLPNQLSKDILSSVSYVETL